MTERFRFAKNFRMVISAIGFIVALLTVMPAQGQIYNNNDAARDNARRAAVAAARGEVDRAQAMLTAATERVRANWKANPQLQTANKAVDDARKDFEAARAKVIEKLRNDPEYAKAEHEDADARVAVTSEQERTNSTQPAATQPSNAPEPGPNLPAPSNSQVTAAADKLRSKTRLRELQETAIAADPTASAAQSKLNAAEQQSKIWQLQFDAALQNDAEYRSALQQLAAAKARVSAASAGN